MSKNKYAILLDNLEGNEHTKLIADQILKHPHFDCTLFLISKENMVANPFPVFSMADYFNFNGVSIITSQATLKKANKYPAGGPKIIIGKDVIKFDLDLIEKVVNDFKHKINVGSRN